MANRSPKRKSVMAHQFSKAPQATVQRSRFNRSFGHKTTINASYLYPIFVDEILPGDTMSVRMDALARLATPLHPIMDNLTIESFWFFVPNRLVWDNWQKFCGEQENPGDSTDYTIPVTRRVGNPYQVGSIHDYFGVPVNQGDNGVDINALPFRCYNLIFREWFRDQNLQDSPEVVTGNGPDGYDTYQLLRRGKRHDYFTSCLPWPAKTDTPVLLPLGSRADVKGIGILDGSDEFTLGPLQVFETGDIPPANTTYADNDAADLTEFRVQQNQNPAQINTPNIYADLTTATSATINEIRQAFQIQKWQERAARGGTRYTEILKSMFGVTSPDARLQRPEYLGGGRSGVQIQTVPSTIPQDQPTDTPQGALAGYGTASISGHGFTKGFVEHGHVIGLINVRADLTYQKGLDRMWSRQTKFDFYWPVFQGLGEQPVYNKEIYVQGTADDDLVFGYQERHAEYRYKNSMITGLFRSVANESLDPWHLSQDFDSLPVLNDSFIQDDAPVDRVIAVQDEPHFLLDMYFNYNCTRPMPVYGVPGYVDHF